MSRWFRFGGSPSAATPSAADYHQEALTRESLGDLDGAITSYQLALRAAPGQVRVLLDLAIALTKAGRPVEAARHYREVLDQAPSEGGAHYGLAFLLARRGQRDAALRHLDQFLASRDAMRVDDRFLQHAEATRARLAQAPTLRALS